MCLCLCSGSSKRINGPALCQSKHSVNSLILNHITTQRVAARGPSHLRSVGDALVGLHEAGPQAGRQALRQRVAVLTSHNQVKSCAELGERESPVSIHITQLPENNSSCNRMSGAVQQYYYNKDAWNYFVFKFCAKRKILGKKNAAFFEMKSLFEKGWDWFTSRRAARRPQRLLKLVIY